jgi:hypothetical protein
VDATGYRRRQRRRAIIAWSVAGFSIVLLALIGLGAAAHNENHRDSASFVHLFPSEMSSSQYEELHKGQGEAQVLQTIGNPGLQEDEVEPVDLLRTFPPRPEASFCNFWKLSDAPDHVVRLCFSEAQEELMQKAVRAPGEGQAETTLALGLRPSEVRPGVS